MRKNGLRVGVIGAGIAGMTAAHELAERGFNVTVIDRKPDPRHPNRPVLGGVAASQFRRAHPPLADGRLGGSDLPFKPLQARKPFSFHDLELEDPVEASHRSGRPFYAFGWPTFVYCGDLEADGAGDDPPGDVPHRLQLHPRSRPIHEEVAQRIQQTIEGSQTDEAIYIVVTYQEDSEEALELARERAQHEALRMARTLGYSDEQIDKRKSEADDDSTLGHGPEGSLTVGPSSLVCTIRLPLSADTEADAVSDPPHVFIMAAVVKLQRSSPAADERCNYLQLRLAQQLLPGEHGYRFFPSFYRNLFDTMDRIPLIELEPKDPFQYHTEVAVQQHLPPKERRPVSRTQPRATRQSVRDNLESVELHAVATQDGNPPAVLPRSSYLSLTGLLKVLDAMQRADMNLPMRDVVRSQLRLLRFMTSCPDRRRGLSDISFLEYITDHDTSEAFHEAVKKWPQALAGLRAGDANARTYAAVMVQLALDQARPGSFRDGTLTGPTTNAWFDHWHDYLSGFHDVEFRVGAVAGVDLPKESRPADDPDSRLRVWWLPGAARDQDARSPELLVSKSATGAEDAVPFDYFVFATDLGAWFAIDGDWRAAEHEEGTPLGFVRKLVMDYAALDGAERERAYVTELGDETARRPDGWAHDLASRGLEPQPPEGDLKAAMDVALDHSQRRLGLGARGPHKEPGPVELPFRQYAGIQFFLARDYRFFRGHMYYPNSPWALSSVSQMQFRQSPPERTTAYGGVLSVIIGAWDTPGLELDKPAWLATPDEIAAEVWTQIEAGLQGVPVLPEEPLYYHIDENMEFGAGAAPTVERNLSPFLVNDARLGGQWPEEPGDYRVHWGQATFCGTWVDTHTRIVTMESANESGRHAVNAILDHVRSTKQRVAVGHDCATFDLELDELADLAPLRALDQELHTRGLPHFLTILKVEDAILPMFAADGPEGEPRDLLAAIQAYARTQGELGSVLAAHLLNAMS